VIIGNAYTQASIKQQELLRDAQRRQWATRMRRTSPPTGRSVLRSIASRSR
jgi:hypothetical protein